MYREKSLKFCEFLIKDFNTLKEKSKIIKFTAFFYIFLTCINIGSLLYYKKKKDKR